MLSLLQASRFFAAAIVVLDHATVTLGMPRYYGYVMLNGLFGSGRYGVDFFFVLSGFIICYAHWEDVAPGANNANAKLMRFAKRRFVRIYPTYWLVVSLTLIPLYLVGTRYDANIRSPWYILDVVTLFQGNGNVLTSAWTLTHEVLFYLLFGIVIWRRNLGVVLLAGWFILSALSFTVEFPSRLLAHPEHLGFLFGMVGCYLVKTASIPVPKFLIALGLAGFAACCVLAGYFHTAGDLNDMLAQADARGPLLPLFFCSMLIVLGLVEVERSHAARAPAALRFLGDASYSIYLLHFPVLDVFIKLFHSLRAERYMSFGVMFCAVVITTILISLLFYKFVERPLLGFVNKVVGTGRAPASGGRVYPISKSIASTKDA